MSSSHHISRRIALAATAFAMIVIVLGAFTRLVDAGLGCPDWPGCYGHVLWPDEHHEIEAANMAYPDMPVDVAKTWPEMIHRYLATALGVFGIALAGLALRYREPGKPLIHQVFLLGFIILQGMFGMWTVTLKLWPQVVTAHLLGGFITFNLLWLLALRLGAFPMRLSLTDIARSRLMKLSALVLGLITLQILLGGWTTSNYAAVACPDFPTCQAQWWPAMDVSAGFNFTQSVGPNYLGGLMDNEARVAIHMAHRLGAIAVVLAVALLVYQLMAYQLQSLAYLVAGATTVQVVLGISNVVFHFPVSVAVAHNLIGAVLAATLVFLLFQLYTARRKEFE